jgi:hypothetical protein
LSIQFKSVIASAVLVFAATAAHAGITTYTSQSAYLAAVGTTGVDTFDDLQVKSYAGPLTRAAGSYAYTVSSAPASPVIFGASDNDVDIWLAPNNSGDSLTFTPATTLAGIGGFFFGSDAFGYSQPSNPLTLTAIDSAGVTITYTLNMPDTGSFVGFVSTANLVSLSVTAGVQAYNWATVNDLHLSASAVPEPETYGLLLSGLALMGYIARRKRNRA